MLSKLGQRACPFVLHCFMQDVVVLCNWWKGYHIYLSNCDISGNDSKYAILGMGIPKWMQKKHVLSLPE